MRKLFILLLASCLLLLTACGQAAIPTRDASIDLPWRKLNLEDEANAEQRMWLESNLSQYVEEKMKHEIEQSENLNKVFRGGAPWGYGVYTRGLHPLVRQIIHKDPVTEEVTILLYGRCTLDIPHTIDQYEQCGEFCAEGPRYIYTLNERYFIYTWFRGFDPEGMIPLGYGVYDLQEMEAHFIELDDAWIRPSLQRGDLLYWENGTRCGYGFFEAHTGALNLFTTSMADLPGLLYTDLLADIPHEPVQMVRNSLLSENGRYYIVVCELGLTIFDLHEQNVFRLERDALDVDLLYNELDFNSIFLRDNMLYWFSEFIHPAFTGMIVAVEITLP